MSARLFTALLLASLSCTAAGAEVACDRIVAVGDLHGGYEDFTTILRETGLVDEQLNWTGGNTHLVQEGNIVDRGDRSRDLLDLLIDLKAQAPEQVHVLLGNHEVMNLTGDLRYVAPAEFASFADEETEAERAVGFQQFLLSEMAEGLDEVSILPEFNRRFPPGWFAYRRAFSPAGRYGSWLLERPTVVKIGVTVFVHAGLIPNDARTGIKASNDKIAREVRDYHFLRGELEKFGWVNPLADFGDSFKVILDRLGSELSSGSNSLNGHVAELAKRFLGLRSASANRMDGPLWNRDYAVGDEEELQPQLEKVLAILKADRLVIAHTTTKGLIQKRFDDRVFMIDTGSGPAYGGHASALDICWIGIIKAIYPGRVEVLLDPPLSDELIEKFLLEGTVIKSELIGEGITAPKKILLELHGATLAAAFKTVDIEAAKMTRFERQGFKLTFTDSYKYERAAYLLDRFLHMNMVPVAVTRTIGGEQGAVVHWISDAMNEAYRRKENVEPPDPAAFVRQREVMRVFDALILNDDRHLGNELITEDDWKLHLIDHSRSFRLTKSLPEGFGDQPISMPRRLHTRLQSMDSEKMQALLKGLVTKPQIKALLVRRDSILEQVEMDRQQYGDELVFH